MKYDQIPKTPSVLFAFIEDLKDGATFTIPDMRKATGVSWHTCNHFIQSFNPRFKPSIIGRGKGLGRPFVYKLLSNGPGIMKPPATVQVGVRAKKYRMKRVSSPVDIDHPELYTESEEYKNRMTEIGLVREDDGWNLLPGARKINALKALFPNGVLPEQYAELFGIVEFIERVSTSLWYKRTEIQKKD